MFYCHKVILGMNWPPENGLSRYATIMTCLWHISIVQWSCGLLLEVSVKINSVHLWPIWHENFAEWRSFVHIYSFTTNQLILPLQPIRQSQKTPREYFGVHREDLYIQTKNCVCETQYSPTATARGVFQYVYAVTLTFDLWPPRSN